MLHQKKAATDIRQGLPLRNKGRTFRRLLRSLQQFMKRFQIELIIAYFVLFVYIIPSKEQSFWAKKIVYNLSPAL